MFNTIRQLVRHPDPKRHLRMEEARRIIRMMEDDVRVRYFAHREADWREVLRTFNVLSEAHACELACRSSDLLHVAYASELSAALFVGFDTDQLAIAQSAGLKVERPS